MLFERFRHASLDFRGFAIQFLIVLGIAFFVNSAAAQDGPVIPGYYDPHERIALPDMSRWQRIRFLTTTDFPPFNFLDQTGRLSGFNIDLARAICAELNVQERCQIQALPWSELQSALAAGQGEAIIAGLAITADTRQRVNFTRAYLQLPARFVRNRKTTIGGSDVSALDARRVGVLAGSAHEAMLRAFFPRIKPVTFTRDDWMFDALKAGSVEAVFSDGLQLSFWLSSESAADCCAFFGGPYLSRQFLGNGLAIATRRNQPGLSTAFDHALLALNRNGRFAEIYLRYFPNGLY